MQRYLALILSLWVGAVQAQMTLACQFREGNGFTWKSGQWQPQRFSPEKPFFLTIGPDKRLDPKSALLAMGSSPEMAESSKSDPSWVHCLRHSKAANSTACAHYSGDSVTVSLTKLEGAVSKISGVTNKVDDIAVMPFVCQKM